MYRIDNLFLENVHCISCIFLYVRASGFKMLNTLSSYNFQNKYSAIRSVHVQNIALQNQNNLCQIITDSFLQGVLFEACLDDKPGLVTSKNNGSHQDMSIITFMSGAVALSPAFYELSYIATEHRDDIKLLLPKLREIGIKYDNRLLSFTGGVNTHRGTLFINGLLSALVGYISSGFSIESDLYDFNSINFLNKLSNNLKDLTRGIIETELITPSKLNLPIKTYGERLYREYGVTGIRGEVENGLPSLFNHALPTLEKSLSSGMSLSESMLNSLFSIMSVLDDTTVYRRGGHAGSVYVKSISNDILDAGILTVKGKKLIEEFKSEAKKRNLSPGGSADILSATIATYFLMKRTFAVEIK